MLALGITRQDSAGRALPLRFDVFNQARGKISAPAQPRSSSSEDAGEEERSGVNERAKFTPSAKAGAGETVAVYKYLQRQRWR